MIMMYPTTSTTNKFRFKNLIDVNITVSTTFWLLFLIAFSLDWRDAGVARVLIVQVLVVQNNDGDDVWSLFLLLLCLLHPSAGRKERSEVSLMNLVNDKKKE